MHPNATELRIPPSDASHLQLGEALRLEMTPAGPDQEDIIHLQYYIATDLGPWALWLSCAREDVADSRRPFGSSLLRSLRSADLVPERVTFLHAKRPGAAVP